MNQQKEIFFHVRDLTKVYQMGEVEVHALRGVNMELYAGELVFFWDPRKRQVHLAQHHGRTRYRHRRICVLPGQELTKATQKELTEYRRFHVGLFFNSTI